MERRGIFDFSFNNRDRTDFAPEPFSQQARDFRFAMQTNGYFLSRNGDWSYQQEAVTPLLEEFRGQQVSFFGPQSYFFSAVGNNDFYSGRDIGAERLINAFHQKEVVDTIGKYRSVDKDQAARIAFLLGGLVRHRGSLNSSSRRLETKIASEVKFAARMIQLGDTDSADAVASAISMYIISGGSIAEDNDLKGYVYKMSEAVSEDPIEPYTSVDLGLSQIARIRGFVDKMQDAEPDDFPNTSEDEEVLDGFPTVGAEFHFPSDAPDRFPYFWQRLAILNMSQYQRGSYIQLSRNDRGVIEVRMNPSTYPITIANWNHMRLLLPELNQAYFTTTFNRQDGGNFSWKKRNDRDLLEKLRSLGMLSYASTIQNIPRSEDDEINFGSIYLGQTVRINNGNYDFSGNWNGGEGSHGQMGIYAGYGDNLPWLVYFPSMALANPEILDSVPEELYEVKTLRDALSVTVKNRRKAFTALQMRIESEERLKNAREAGSRIIQQFHI